MGNASSARASGHINFNLSFTYVKGFSRFLLERIDEADKEYFKLYSERNRDLFRLIDKKGKAEVKELLKTDLKSFLKNLATESFEEVDLIEIAKKNITYLPGFYKVFFNTADINLKFNLINKLFLKFLPVYSSDVTVVVEVMNELEEILLYLKHKIGSLQVDLNHQHIKKERNLAESLINHSTNGVLSFNTDAEITSWNKVMETTSGIKSEFVLGKKLFDLFPEYQETEEGRAVSKVLNGEKVYISERAFANNKGFYEANAIPIMGLDNEVIGGFIIFNDTTQKRLAAQKIQESKLSLEKLNFELLSQINQLKKTEDQLRNNEKLLRKTQQLAHMGNWVWDVRANQIILSDELCEIFGISDPVSPATIKTYMKMVHPEERGLVLKRIREAVRSHNSFDYEHRIILPNGSVRYIYGEGIPEMNNGKLIITGFAQDISLKMKAIETLQASENRFRTLCEKSPDAIFLVDRKKILYCNQAAVIMLMETSKNQVLKHSFLDLSPEKNNFSIPNDLNISLQRAFDGESLRFESVLNKFNGESFWAEIIFTPIKLEEQDILHVVIRDVSARKEAETNIIIAQKALEKINNELEARIAERTRDLEEINQNLRRVNADMDNFIYSASHDLKAPILNIEGLINELVQFPCYGEGEVKVLIDMMRLCVQKFTRTIQDLTDVTKTLRSEEADIKPVDLEELLKDIKVSIRNFISSSEARIDYDFSSCKFITFSRHSLYSVLSNLINNGIKYRSPKRAPEIFIETHEHDDFIEVSVRDNGLGLRTTDKEKIFQMFKRAHNHVEGSGVGLYLVKRIMENAGGRVELVSELGVGSEFKLFFRKELN